MKVNREEMKIKPKLRLSEDFIDLRTLDAGIIVKHLEHSMRMRELSIDKRLAERLKGKEQS